MPSYVPSNPEFDDLPPLLDDETVPIFDITGRSTHRIIRRVETLESQWLDSGSKSNPLTKLEKQLMCMARNGVPLATEGAEDLPGDEQESFKFSSFSSRQQDSSFKLPRVGQPPVVANGPTPVTHETAIPGVRVWVTKADQILAATGMPDEKNADDPNKPGHIFIDGTAVYIRFRNDGKLKNAGAGYYLAPSLSHLITSVYNGLAFKRQQQHHFLDVGITNGERTCLTSPYCYPAELSPGVTTHTCKKGNVYAYAQCRVSFRLGDVGVGHPDWVEATRDDGGMNVRSQGGGPGYNRLLLIMTELLTTRILAFINSMP